MKNIIFAEKLTFVMNMNRLIIFALCLFGAVLACKAQSQMDASRMDALVQGELERMQQEGWKVAPGILPLEMQLRESYGLALEKDADGCTKYFVGEATTTASDYNVALSQTATLAKLDMAGKIQSEIVGLIETNAAGLPEGSAEAASALQAAVSCKNTVSQRIGRVVTPLCVYRPLDNGKVQVRTVIYYSHDQALAVYKQTLREALERKADAWSEEMDRLLGL